MAIIIKEQFHPIVKVLRVEFVREKGLINCHVFRPSLRRYCGCTIIKFFHTSFILYCI